ncbi:MAG: tetratricopeptide repeat-containing glycosyltransferase family 2 protein [Chloroflexota bacterium]
MRPVRWLPNRSREAGGKVGRSPSVSVCMIVKNEAANLRACVESLGDLASEIVVVDTGSTDDTVQVAESLGARVYPFAWIDDFAAARNESLRHATGEWVFWLDADDRLCPEVVAQLRRAVASGRSDAYSCLVASRKPNGSEDVVEHIRLFRNGLGIGFQGAIHETVAPDIARLGLRLSGTGATILHGGYASPEETRRKSERNLAILERELALHPERVDLLCYRGQCRRALGDADGAESDMREFLVRSRPVDRFDWGRFWAYASLAFILEGKGAAGEMRDLLQKALTEFPGHPQFLFMLGRAAIGLQQPDDAVRQLLSAHHGMGRPWQGLLPSPARLAASLAEGYRANRETREAVRWAEEAVRHAPGWDEAARLLDVLYVELDQLQGLALLKQGEPMKAAERFAEAIQKAPTNPDNYRYLALALRNAGLEEEALEAWRLAEHWKAQA